MAGCSRLNGRSASAVSAAVVNTHSWSAGCQTTGGSREGETRINCIPFSGCSEYLVSSESRISRCLCQPSGGLTSLWIAG